MSRKPAKTAVVAFKVEEELAEFRVYMVIAPADEELNVLDDLRDRSRLHERLRQCWPR